MKRHNVEVPDEKIAEFCRRWRVTEFALFGSIVRDDFGPESDVDVLVSFAADASWDLFDIVDMTDELAGMFGREVDLVQREGLKNPFRRRAILSSFEVVYTG
jgi:predicted nucleotidyltransferase